MAYEQLLCQGGNVGTQDLHRFRHPDLSEGERLQTGKTRNRVPKNTQIGSDILKALRKKCHREEKRGTELWLLRSGNERKSGFLFVKLIGKLERSRCLTLQYTERFLSNTTA